MVLMNLKNYKKQTFFHRPTDFVPKLRGAVQLHDVRHAIRNNWRTACEIIMGTLLEARRTYICNRVPYWCDGPSGRLGSGCVRAAMPSSKRSAFVCSRCKLYNEGTKNELYIALLNADRFSFTYT